MIDIHCHILPAIDDGCKDLDESLGLLKKASESGISDVILTPHYIKKSKYHCNNEFKKQLLAVLREGCAREGIEINLHLGNEIYIDTEIKKLLENAEAMSLAGSRYVLIELPVRAEDMSAKTTCFELVSMGYVPVIAHPERYEYMQDDIRKLDEFLEIGCLAQGDYLALTGRYGKRAMRILKQMIFNGQISFLASDVHGKHDDYGLKMAEKKLLMILKDKNKVQKLLVDNPRAVIEDKPIERLFW